MKRRKSLQKSRCPVAICPYLCSSEACERVAVAQKLRELGDEDPEVFAGAIRRALQDADGEADGDSGGLSAARRFYGRPSACERLLSSLVDYPRSLPLGSSDVSNAVSLDYAMPYYTTLYYTIIYYIIL